MTDPNKPWEPDPKKMGNWASMFEPKAREDALAQPPASASVRTDDGALIGPDETSAQYRPWLLQRGRSQPAMMLLFRKFDPRSGLWIGWQAAYPQLNAVDFIGDRMVSLDFGIRQFVLEGRGLDELARHIQSGSVLTIEEFSAHVWPQPESGPVITKIEKIELTG